MFSVYLTLLFVLFLVGHFSYIFLSVLLSIGQLLILAMNVIKNVGDPIV